MIRPAPALAALSLAVLAAAPVRAGLLPPAFEAAASPGEPPFRARTPDGLVGLLPGATFRFGPPEGPFVDAVFEGARRGAAWRGERRSPGVVTRIRPGAAPREIARFDRVRLDEAWPGVDVVFRADAAGVSYDLHVAAGADESCVAFRVVGAVPRVARDGFLELDTPAGILRHRPPVAWTENGRGRRAAVPARFRVRPDGLVAFDLGARNRAHRLVVDPSLDFSTFLGGSSADAANAVATDAAGSVYVAGETTSTNFPTTVGVVQPARASLTDAFVAKLDPTGTNLLWATYLGGDGADVATALAVTPAGDVFVGGETTSAAFPVTAGAFQTTRSGASDGWVARLDPAGAALVYSTLVGGTQSDRVNGIALVGGEVVGVGRTSSTDFPATGLALQNGYGGGDFDAFAFRVAASGTALVWSTFLGGEENDAALGVAVDVTGRVAVAGGTRSFGYPLTATAIQSTPFETDSFLTLLSADGSATPFSTLLGGTSIDRGSVPAFAADGTVWMAGLTSSPDFPFVVPLGLFRGSFDAFVIRVDPTRSGPAALLFSSPFGGPGDDRAFGLALDADGSPLVTGQAGPGFPLAGTPAAAAGGGISDAFVLRLAPTAAAVTYSFAFGGTGDDRGFGIAAAGSSRVLVAGRTSSADFRTRLPVQPVNAGAGDAFVLRLVPQDPAPAATGPPVPDGGTAARVALVAALCLAGWSLGRRPLG